MEKRLTSTLSSVNFIISLANQKLCILPVKGWCCPMIRVQSLLNLCSQPFSACKCPTLSPLVLLYVLKYPSLADASLDILTVNHVFLVLGQ